eukprot:GHVQ01016232.1.p1 GENE.GHVQ01016232.1~~GHVQ01016232.1.p1  ORF type:complete len:591 (+),score=108.62 GHVQ01016232.1:100-1872(+)
MMSCLLCLSVLFVSPQQVAFPIAADKLYSTVVPAESLKENHYIPNSFPDVTIMSESYMHLGMNNAVALFLNGHCQNPENRVAGEGDQGSRGSICQVPCFPIGWKQPCNTRAVKHVGADGEVTLDPRAEKLLQVTEYCDEGTEEIQKMTSRKEECKRAGIKIGNVDREDSMHIQGCNEIQGTGDYEGCHAAIFKLLLNTGYPLPANTEASALGFPVPADIGKFVQPQSTLWLTGKALVLALGDIKKMGLFEEHSTRAEPIEMPHWKPSQPKQTERAEPVDLPHSSSSKRKSRWSFSKPPRWNSSVFSSSNDAAANWREKRRAMQRDWAKRGGFLEQQQQQKQQQQQQQQHNIQGQGAGEQRTAEENEKDRHEKPLNVQGSSAEVRPHRGEAVYSGLKKNTDTTVGGGSFIETQSMQKTPVKGVRESDSGDKGFLSMAKKEEEPTSEVYSEGDVEDAVSAPNGAVSAESESNLMEPGSLLQEAEDTMLSRVISSTKKFCSYPAEGNVLKTPKGDMPLDKWTYDTCLKLIYGISIVEAVGAKRIDYVLKIGEKKVELGWKFGALFTKLISRAPEYFRDAFVLGAEHFRENAVE